MCPAEKYYTNTTKEEHDSLHESKTPLFYCCCDCFAPPKVCLDALKRCFDAEAAGRTLAGGDTTPPLEVLDALRAGLEVRGTRRTGMVTLADFERYHQVKWMVLDIFALAVCPSVLLEHPKVSFICGSDCSSH